MISLRFSKHIVKFMQTSHQLFAHVHMQVKLAFEAVKALSKQYTFIVDLSSSIAEECTYWYILYKLYRHVYMPQGLLSPENLKLFTETRLCIGKKLRAQNYIKESLGSTTLCKDGYVNDFLSHQKSRAICTGAQVKLAVKALSQQ